MKLKLLFLNWVKQDELLIVLDLTSWIYLDNIG